MKKITTWFFGNSPANADTMDFALAFLRIFAGLAMLPYGWGKIERYESLRENFFGNPIGIGDEPSLIVCIFQQIVCSVLLVLGVQSRFAAFMLFTNMAVAVKFHFFDPFCAVKALPTVFLAIYAFLTISGGGRFSVDTLIFRNRGRVSAGNGKNRFAMRVALMAAGFCILWVAFGNLLGLGGIAGAMLVSVAVVMLAVSIYGFIPASK